MEDEGDEVGAETGFDYDGGFGCVFRWVGGVGEDDGVGLGGWFCCGGRGCMLGVDG